MDISSAYNMSSNDLLYRISNIVFFVSGLVFTESLQIQCKYQSDYQQRRNDSDNIDQNIFDRSAAFLNEQLMILIKDRIQCADPKRYQYINFII